MTMKLNHSPQNPIRIGTRRSPLALAQAQMVVDLLRATFNLAADAVVTVPMLASGDVILDRPIAEIGGKAVWTKELERALLDDEIDIAVHSMKDVETVRPECFTIAAMLERADVRDRLIGATSIAALAHGARVGTSSPRRAAQMQSIRPDLSIVPLRGNVATRLDHIAQNRADATLLAAAGLDRLAMQDTGVAIAIDEMLPAAAQGAIGIDILSARHDLGKAMAAINHQPTFAAVHAERAFLQSVGGNCHSPIAVYATVMDDEILLRAEILSADGQEHVAGAHCYFSGDEHGPAKLAEQLLAQASPALKALFAR